MFPSVNLDELTDSVQFITGHTPSLTQKYHLNIENDDVALEDEEVFILHLNSPSNSSVHIGGNEGELDYYAATRIPILDDDCEYLRSSVRFFHNL